MNIADIHNTILSTGHIFFLDYIPSIHNGGRNNASLELWEQLKSISKEHGDIPVLTVKSPYNKTSKGL